MPSDVNEHHRDQHDHNDVDHVHDHADILQSRGADPKQQVRVFGQALLDHQAEHDRDHRICNEKGY